ncbi:cytosine permease [Egicoccus halophilus]|uniref:Purine-cytosine permease n=1 Tax=Egicoccus halophilus TaxID=1670830 RepID=A0A8J3EST8_9ACTN|nr:cytosine permease [Egicoccus halophilus]GGI03769.1 purine-cytosine permease [Egicoccus halophilus]
MSDLASTRASQPSDVDPDYPLQIVPAHARKGVLSLGVVLLGFTFFTPTMLAGASIAPAFSFGQFLTIALLGSIVLGVYVSALGAVGARSGLTTVVMARYAFGEKGAKLVSLLLGGTQIGWYGVTVATLALLTQQVTGLDGPLWRWILILGGGAVMGLTAYFGYRGMELLSAVSVPLLLVLAGWVTWRSLTEIGGLGGLGEVTGTGELTVAAAVTAIVGTFASGGTQAPNWTRFARTPTQGFSSAAIAFIVGELLMIFFGGIGALAFGIGDFVEVLFALNLIGWGLVFLVANLWTTNDNTAYNFGVAGAELFNANTKKPFVIGGVVIGTLLALPIYDNLIGYLSWLGILIPAIGGVLIGDHVANWRRGMPEPLAYRFPAVRWENVAVYAVATLAAWISSRQGILIPPVVAIVLAVVGAYAVGRRLTPDLGQPVAAA